MAKKIKIKKPKQFDIAMQYYIANNLEQAGMACRWILQGSPNHSDTWHLFGMIEYQNREYDSAISHIQKAVFIDPSKYFYHHNLGLIYLDKGLPDEAIEHFKKALTLKPHLFEAYNNIGLAFSDKDMLDDAIENYNRALTLNPDYAESYNNIGLAFKSKGLLDRAVENYKKALTLKPDYIDAHTNLAMIYILTKDFDAGWKEYEWRLKEIRNISLKRPCWDGSSLVGKTILVYPEQGYGDTLQFVRYLPLLYDEYNTANVLFIPQNGLERLLRESDLKAEILDAGTPVESLEYDTNIHLLSLPRIFKTNLENIPFKQKRYLMANPEKVEWYREKFFNLQLSTCNFQLKVGIFWQGSPTLKPDRNRSMPLRFFYPLCGLPGVKVYSLQKGYGIEQLDELPEDIDIINLGETFNDFSDTAAAIENLDLVITV
ncbi:MAG: tetratricopeptide repeat protein, partial [Nitrospiraceae bacterium]